MGQYTKRWLSFVLMFCLIFSDVAVFAQETIPQQTNLYQIVEGTREYLQNGDSIQSTDTLYWEQNVVYENAGKISVIVPNGLQPENVTVQYENNKQSISSDGTNTFVITEELIQSLLPGTDGGKSDSDQTTGTGDGESDGDQTTGTGGGESDGDQTTGTGGGESDGDQTTGTGDGESDGDQTTGTDTTDVPQIDTNVSSNEPLTQTATVVLTITAECTIDTNQVNDGKIVIDGLTLVVSDSQPDTEQILPFESYTSELYPQDVYDSTQTPEQNRPNAIKENAIISKNDVFDYVVHIDFETEQIQQNQVYQVPLPENMVTTGTLSEQTISFTLSIDKNGNGLIESQETFQIPFASMWANANSDFFNVRFQIDYEALENAIEGVESKPANEYELSDLQETHIVFGCELSDDAEYDSENGIIEIVLPGSAEHTLQLVVREFQPTAPVLTKTTEGMNEQGITTWQISYTAAGSGYQGEQPTMLKDIIPKGMTLVSDSMEVSIDGTTMTNEMYTESVPVTPITPSNEIHIPIPEQATMVSVTYQTTLTDEALYQYWADNNKQKKFQNTVSGMVSDGADGWRVATVDGAALTATASTTFHESFLPLVQKSVSKNIYQEITESGETKTVLLTEIPSTVTTNATYWIDFCVTVNTREFAFSKFSIVDTYEQGFEMPDATKMNVRLVQGETVIGVEPDDILINHNNKTFTVNVSKYFQNDGIAKTLTNGSFELQYRLQVNTEYLLQLNVENLKNTAKASYTHKDYDGMSASSNAKPTKPEDANYQLLTKTNTGYNQNKRQFTWEVTVNPARTENQYQPNIQTLVLEDVFVNGASETNYDWQAFYIFDGNEKEGTEEYEENFIKNSIQTSMQNAGITNGIVRVDIVENDSQRKLRIEVENLGTNTLKFKFHTYAIKLTDWAWNYNGGTYFNTIQMTTDSIVDGKKLTQPISAQSSRQVWGTVLTKQVVDYNINTQTIFWRIVLNERCSPLGNVKLTDIIPEGLYFVENSLRIDDHVVNGKDNLTMTDTGFTLYLNNVQERHVIQYQTKIDVNSDIFRNNKNVTFKNGLTLQIEGQDRFTNGWATVQSTSATAKIQNALLSKEHIFNQNTTGNKVEYTVKLNPHGIDLLNGVPNPESTILYLKDTLPDGLVLDLESIQLHRATVVESKNGSGVYVPNFTQQTKLTPQYTYDALTNALSVKMPKDNKPYILTYTAYITKANTDLTNKVELIGSGISADANSANGAASQVRFNASGGAVLQLLPPQYKFVTVVIHITEKDSTIPLDDVTFGVYTEKDSTTFLAKSSSDSNGNCLITVPKNKLPENITKLYIRQITPKDGYYTFDGWKETTIGTEKPETINVTNEKIQNLDSCGSLKITVTQCDTTTPVANMTFTIKNQDGTFTRTRNTDSFGTVTFIGLPEGTYTVTETNTPEHWYTEVITDDIVAITAKQETIREYCKTVADVDITIHKVDHTDKTPLAGVVFGLYEDETCTTQIGETQTTNADGICTFTVKPQHVYYIKEVQPPMGYYAQNTVYRIEQELGQYKTIQIENTTKPVDLMVIKVDADTQAPLSDTILSLYEDAECKIHAGTAKTDENGTCTFQNLLPERTYYLVEDKSPIGYERLETLIEVQTKLGETATFTIENEKSPTYVTINKYDFDTGERIQGAEFTLYKKSGEVLQRKISDNDGNVAFTVPIYHGSEYFVRETKVAEGGYVDNPEILVITPQRTDANKTISKAVGNTKKLLSITIEKVDADTGNMIQGAVFALTDTNEEVLFDEFQTTDVNGICTFDGLLPYTSYHLWEVTPPNGYERVDGPIEVVLEEENKIVSVENEKIVTPPSGGGGGGGSSEPSNPPEDIPELPEFEEPTEEPVEEPTEEPTEEPAEESEAVTESELTEDINSIVDWFGEEPLPELIQEENISEQFEEIKETVETEIVNEFMQWAEKQPKLSEIPTEQVQEITKEFVEWVTEEHITPPQTQEEISEIVETFAKQIAQNHTDLTEEEIQAVVKGFFVWINEETESTSDTSSTTTNTTPNTSSTTTTNTIPKTGIKDNTIYYVVGMLFSVASLIWLQWKNKQKNQ